MHLFHNYIKLQPLIMQVIYTSLHYGYHIHLYTNANIILIIGIIWSQVDKDRRFAGNQDSCTSEKLFEEVFKTKGINICVLVDYDCKGCHGNNLFSSWTGVAALHFILLRQICQ